MSKRIGLAKPQLASPAPSAKLYWKACTYMLVFLLVYRKALRLEAYVRRLVESCGSFMRNSCMFLSGHHATPRAKVAFRNDL